MNPIYKNQYKYLENSIYGEINYSILNSQFLSIYLNNIAFNTNNKKDYFFYYNNNNWYKYPYYISGVFLTGLPIELIPYIKWKIENIKQRL